MTDATSTASLPTTTLLPTLSKAELEAVYAGCRRPFPNDSLNGHTVYEDLTIELCIHDCRQKGIRLAGLYGGSKCLCGTRGGNLSPNGCTIPCTGNADQICGGIDNGSPSMSIYRVQ
ncbi:unnamed protein product [Owenia fusiformis]|uniref:WSC domain-containing protein n=1 Tax=Owenia fusiformis TaxID=6347 RepID=A0A8S4NIK2_OWEFU|nr:unnamed protein product [Owenia fusiformis]